MPMKLYKLFVKVYPYETKRIVSYLKIKIISLKKNHRKSSSSKNHESWIGTVKSIMNATKKLIKAPIYIP